MAYRPLFRAVFLRSRPFSSAVSENVALTSTADERLCNYAATIAIDAESDGEKAKEKRDNWFTLPPFSPMIDGATLGKAIVNQHYSTKYNTTSVTATSTTALKWILLCCPDLPKSLVQKLFRLRQVRRESINVEAEQRKLKRVGAKDSMNIGDQIHLPITVKKSLPVEADDECVYSEEEMSFLQSLELYKDSAIIVINKPPGIPVQGGIGIKRSIDKLAAKYLKYEYPDSPRLVHRLDRDCSGVLVMGRTQLSARVLHSIFREKTSRAPNNCKRKIMRKSYWALVIGTPRRPSGLITVPLGKVVVDDGKSERITVIDDINSSSAQYAATEYRVIGTSSHGYTWLELSPITGRKHQLRVHCAEVLGTPIVGDYKYGWQAHRKLKHDWNFSEEKLGSGSISDKQSLLHLHCKEMVLPKISLALQQNLLDLDGEVEELESIKLDAPLPSHMQRSWDLLNSS